MSLLRDPRNPLARSKIRLRRLRDAGALVALGMVLPHFPQDEINTCKRRVSGLLNTPALRKLRLRFRLFGPSKWPVPGLENFIFPVAVTRTRFAAALLVFFLGIINHLQFFFSTQPCNLHSSILPAQRDNPAWKRVNLSYAPPRVQPFFQTTHNLYHPHAKQL